MKMPEHGEATCTERSYCKDRLSFIKAALFAMVMLATVLVVISGGSARAAVQMEIVVDGTGAGRVSSNIQDIAFDYAGWACGGANIASLDSGTNVELTASAAAGSAAQWIFCPGSLNGMTCSFTMQDNVYPVVMFSRSQYNLTFNTDGNGGGSLSWMGSGKFYYGDQVFSKPTNAPGSHLAGWSGSNCPSDPSNAFGMPDRDVSCTATFSLNQHNLTVNTAGNGSGTVAGGGTYNYGSSNQVTAAVSAGSTFRGWSGDCTGSATSTSVTMADQNQTCTATFTRNTITAAATGNGAGWIGSSSGGLNYSYPPNKTGTTSTAFDGSSVVLTATVAEGAMVAWTTCTGTTSGNWTDTATCTYSLPLAKDQTAQATFILYLDALIDFGDGTIYDTGTQLSWLKNAQLGGQKNWDQAVAWAAGLNNNGGYAGLTGWRLPTVTQPDPSCNVQNNNSGSGTKCTGSEFGHLYYESLKNTAGGCIARTAPFTNLGCDFYWTGTQMDAGNAWDFIMNGDQAGAVKSNDWLRAWAVRSGPRQLSRNTVAYYPLDGNGDDTSGHGYHGTVNGATFVAGRHGQAASFDNVNDNIAVPSPAGHLPGGNSARTVAFWAKPSTTADNGYMVSWGSEGTGKVFALFMRAGGALDVIGHGYDFESGYTMSAGVWQHIAVTYDGTDLQFYVNGSLQSTRTAGAFNTDPSKALRIGALIDGWDWDFFGGEIDDLRIYGRAILPSEVFDLTYKYSTGGSIQGAPLDLDNANAAVTTLAGIAQVPGATDGTGVAARFNLPYGMTTDGTNLYLADAENHKIRKIEISTGAVTTIAGTGSCGSLDGLGKEAGFCYPFGITTDGTNLFVADSYNHTIRKIFIPTGVVTTLAGSVGAAGWSDGTGPAARFYRPFALTTDRTSLFVADTENHAIRKIVISTGAVSTLAGSPGSSGSSDGTGAAAGFYNPTGITTDGANLFVADRDNYTIRKIAISSGEVTTLAGTAGEIGSGDGTGPAARFNSPYGNLTTDGTNLFMADSNNQTIRKIVISSGVVTTIAGNAGAAGLVDGIGLAASFLTPAGITTDGINLFVADNNNHAIRKISRVTMGGAIQRFRRDLNLYPANAAVTTLAGIAGTFGSSDGTGQAARFKMPVGVTTDGTSLYLADAENHKIRKVEISTGAVTTLAGTGSCGSSDGPGSAAGFCSPFGITTDGTNLFVADSYNHSIRRVVIATGAVTTIAGTAKVIGSIDGIGRAAGFYRPNDLTTDGISLFVADTENHTIRKIVIATGMVTTFAGTAGASGSSDGTGPAARFHNPIGITTDGYYLYVADKDNYTIRKIDIATGEVTTLAGTAGVSGSSDGTGPAAGFNNIYAGHITTDGTNLFMADSSNQTIRKIVISSGVVTTLAGTAGSFNSADGIGPEASFRVPAGITTDGISLFVVDNNNHTIRKISRATMGGAIQGIPRNLNLNNSNAGVATLAGSGEQGSADGVGTAASFNQPWGVTTDGTDLYVTDYVNNNIRKMELASGAVTTLAGSGEATFADGIGLAAGFNGPTGITTDGLNLYVSDQNNQRIRRIVIATGVVTTLAGSGAWGNADAVGTAATFKNPAGLTTDGASLYVADNWNHGIRKISIATGVVTTLAGGTQGSADGTGTAAGFYHPFGVTTDGANLYVVDSYNNKIRKVVIATGVVTTLAGSGAQGSADGIGTAASFLDPRGITTDGTNLYVPDANHVIRKVVIASGVVTTLAGTAGSGGSSDGLGSAAQFNYPLGITTDGANLYVIDPTLRKIRKVSRIGMGGAVQGIPLNLNLDTAYASVTTLAGSGWPGSADGAGAAAGFNNPWNMTTDGTNLYLADCGNNKVRKIEMTSGVVTTFAGSGAAAFADGTGAAASFNCPTGITTDGSNLYVSDQGNQRIRKIGIAAGVVTTLAGSGAWGHTDAVGTAATFKDPDGLTTDGTNLYVADRWNHGIRKIALATGVVTTLAGGTQGSADGTGTAAGFYFPFDVTTDGANLYVVDAYNNTIRKIVIATGVVTTLAGSGAAGSADGVGTAASFRNPRGLTTDGTYVYVADFGNHSVRKIGIASGAVTTLAGSGSVDFWNPDGIGTAADFYYPLGITTDGVKLYLVDQGYPRIRKISVGYGVTATATGNGTGTVSSDGGGISYSYPANSTRTSSAFDFGMSVTLTAAAGTGSTVAWTTCAGTTAGNGTATATCTYSSLAAGQTAQATFILHQYNLNFRTDGTSGGALTGTTTQTVNYGGNATAVTANAPIGYHLVNWTGDGGFVTTAANPLTVENVTATQAITANFAIDTFGISFVSGGNGTLTGTAGQTVDFGASATAVTAVPATGYHFVNWTGTGGFVTTAANPLTVAGVTAAQAITANFADITAPVISNSAPADGSFINSGQVGYTLSETVASGSITFTRSGGTADASSPRTYTFIPADRTGGSHTISGIALQSGAVYTIAIDAADGAGNPAATAGITNVAYDSSAAVVSIDTPAPGVRTNNVSVGYTLSEQLSSGTISFTRTGGTADPAPHTYTLTGAELAGGGHTVNSGFTLLNGAVYTITISGITDQADNPTTDVTVSGILFDNTALPVSLTSPASGSGTTTTRAGITLGEDALAASITFTRTGGTADASSPQTYTLSGADLPAGSRTITTALPLVNDAIYSVSLAATDLAGNPATTVTVTSVTYNDRFTLSAIKDGNGHGTVTAPAGLGSGISCGATCAETYTPGTSVTLAATADTGSGVALWSGCDSSNATECTVSMSGAKAVTAKFTLYSYTVTFASGGNGTLTGAVSQSVNYGGGATAVTANPAAGYHFVNWTDGAAILPAGATLTASNVTSAHSYTANFAPDPVNAACGGADGGTFTGAPADNLCSVGNPSAVAGTGPFTWTCSGANGGAGAYCSAAIHGTTLLFRSAGNGIVSGRASQIVQYGGSASQVKAIPSTGFNFVSWTGTNGFATSSSNPLTVTNVVAGMTITANFAAQANDGTCGSANGVMASSAPTAGLCSSGTASGISGSGPWTWACNGNNGGVATNCFAPAAPVNHPPVISGDPSPSALAGASYTFKPVAGDQDGDTLTFAINGKPSWATFDSTTGIMTGTATARTYGGIVISVSDATHTVSLPPFTITGAAGPNHAPVIYGVPGIKAIVGTTYIFTPTAGDPDGNALSFGIQNMPSWALFDTASGTLRGHPSSSDIGNFDNIRITVSDGGSTATLAPFGIAVAGTGVTSVATGSSVTSSPAANVSVTFNSVTNAGTVSVTTNPAPAAPPANFQVLAGSQYMITSTASFSGILNVCVGYDPNTLADPSDAGRLVLQHWNGQSWEQLATTVDTVNHGICGTVTSLSPFSVMVPTNVVSTATPAPGSYTASALQVTLSATNGATIHYTTNGDTPTAGSPVYGSPIQLTGTTTLKYFAKTATASEPVKTAVYAVSNGSQPAASFKGVKSGGTFTVLRSDGGGDYTPVASGGAATSFTDTSALKPNTIHKYAVTSDTDSTETIFMAVRTPMYNGWNIIAVPYNTTGLPVSRVFASPVGAVYEWMPGGTSMESDTIQKGSYAAVTSLTPGKGYFVKASNSSTMVLYGGTVNALPTTVTLKPGWTMIANPNPGNMTDIGTAWQIDGQPLSAAVSAGTVGGSLYWWNGTTYDFWSIGSNPQIQPWKGYWIVNQTSSSHTLTLQ